MSQDTDDILQSTVTIQHGVDKVKALYILRQERLWLVFYEVLYSGIDISSVSCILAGVGGPTRI